MSSLTALQAMGDALYGVLAFDATLLASATGGVFMDVPSSPSFPLVWVELQQDREHGGFGSMPGRLDKPGIELRLHVYQSEGGTLRTAQVIMARLVALVWNDSAPLSPVGYTVISGKPLPNAQTFQLSDQELRGFKVKETVLMADYVLEATS
jgi:hypothetical protein